MILSSLMLLLFLFALFYTSVKCKIKNLLFCRHDDVAVNNSLLGSTFKNKSFTIDLQLIHVFILIDSLLSHRLGIIFVTKIIDFTKFSAKS